MDLELGMKGAGRFTRRNFIERLGAIGGVTLAMAGMDALGFGMASAQAAPPKLGGSTSGKKVIILGAGLAGMTSALELSKAGYECQILEARSFAGGRCQTARAGFSLNELGGEQQTCNFDKGEYFNHAAWRIPYHHKSTLYYTKSLGVPLEIFVNDNEAAYLYYEKGTGPMAGKPVRRGQVAADMRGYTAELLAKVVQTGALDQRFTAADRDAFIAYLVGEGMLSPKDLAYGPTAGRGFDVYPGAGVDPGAGKLSAPMRFEDVLHTKMWDRLSSASDDHPKTMFQAVGGMDRIAKAFEERVGKMITYSTVVEKIEQNDSGVRVSFVDAAGKRGTAAGDFCICTIPLSVLKGIDMQVSPRFKEAMSGVAYTAVGKIGLQMKRRFWEEDHGIYGGLIQTDNPEWGSVALPSSNWQGQKGVLLGYYNFGSMAAKVSAKTLAQRAEFAVSQGQKIFPEYRDSFETAFSASWHRVEHNLGGWAQWKEDGRRDAYPLLCEPDGRIYLAGEHLSHLSGWQAGAIESAWQQIAKLHRRVQA